jgi:hypothetical protein
VSLGLVFDYSTSGGGSVVWSDFATSNSDQRVQIFLEKRGWVCRGKQWRGMKRLRASTPAVEKATLKDFFFFYRLFAGGMNVYKEREREREEKGREKARKFIVPPSAFVYVNVT